MGNLAVQIKNYQILENAKLEFEDGLNIIVGPSNNGKSAIIRAIEALTYNKAGNSFIRSGTNGAAVAIRTEDGHTIIWSKSSDEGIYKVDGQVYNKIGRGQLTEVANILGMSEISINDDKVRINFLKQMEYPFLLDKNPSQLFSFLSMSNDGDRLTGIFSDMRSDLKKTNSEIDTVLGKIDVYKEQITREQNLIKNYQGIDELNDRVLSFDSKAQRLTQMQMKLESVKALKEKLISLREEILKLRKIKSDLEAVYGDLDNRMSILTKQKDSFKDLSDKRTSLKGIQDTYRQDKEVLKVFDENLSKIDISSYEEHKSRLDGLKSSFTSLKTKSDTLTKESSDLNQLKSDLSQAESSLAEFNVCPLCGQLLPHTHS